MPLGSRAPICMKSTPAMTICAGDHKAHTLRPISRQFRRARREQPTDQQVERHQSGDKIGPLTRLQKRCDPSADHVRHQHCGEEDAPKKAVRLAAFAHRQRRRARQKADSAAQNMQPKQRGRAPVYISRRLNGKPQGIRMGAYRKADPQKSNRNNRPHIRPLVSYRREFESLPIFDKRAMIKRATLMIAGNKRRPVSVQTTSASIARGLLEFAVKHGADRDNVLAAAGITFTALEDPDARITTNAYLELSRAAQSACNDPALSLRFSEAVDMSEVSIVGLIMNAAPTMLDAFMQMQRFGRLAAEVETASDGPRFTLELSDGHPWMVDHHSNPNVYPELTEAAFVRLVAGPRRFLSQPHVLEVHFTYTAPSYAAEYDRVFQCPVRFDADWNAMRLHPAIAEWRVALQPRYVFGVLIEHAERLIARLDAAKTVRGEIERRLVPILHTGDLTADVVAVQMGFSRQTLFRKLKAEGTSFEGILADLRRDMAIQYLRGAKTSVNEIAYLVGFSDPSAFSRAFKRWTGQSPKAYRTAAAKQG